MTQHHTTAHYRKALKITKQASTTHNKITLDRTIHIQATPQTTTFTSSNENTEIQTTIPTTNKQGQTWGHTIRDSINDNDYLIKRSAKKEQTRYLPGFEPPTPFVTLQPTPNAILVTNTISTSAQIALPIEDLEYPIQMINHQLRNPEPARLASLDMDINEFKLLSIIQSFSNDDKIRIQFTPTRIYCTTEIEDDDGIIEVRAMTAIKGHTS